MIEFIKAEKMKSEFVRILISNGFNDTKADKCAEIFTLNSLEGIYSHGVNRFPRFVDYLKKGYIKPDAEPSLVSNTGSLEQWNGNLGPGPLNASFATERAMELASLNGIGLLALANTNHWMRGGTYGWQAARQGFVFIGWTNTEANMPVWGAKDFRIGNNPLVMAVPYEKDAIVLDFAMSQYSYGKMELYQIEKKQLPYPGGFNVSGELTADPGVILQTRRALPVGYWKGSGLSLLLDILAAVLSGGLSTHQISRLESEYSLSQVFIAIDLGKLANYDSIGRSVSSIIMNIKASDLVDKKYGIRYPGENVLKIKAENLENGIPVNREVWQTILSL